MAGHCFFLPPWGLVERGDPSSESSCSEAGWLLPTCSPGTKQGNDMTVTSACTVLYEPSPKQCSLWYPLAFALHSCPLLFLWPPASQLLPLSPECHWLPSSLVAFQAFSLTFHHLPKVQTQTSACVMDISAIVHPSNNGSLTLVLTGEMMACDKAARLRKLRIRVGLGSSTLSSHLVLHHEVSNMYQRQTNHPYCCNS